MKVWISLVAIFCYAQWCEASGGTTNAPAKPGVRTFAIRGFQVNGNTLLPPERIAGVLTNYTGPAVDLARLTEGLGDLQLLYRRLGFATVSVTLPQQKLTNGIVQVEVVEGRLSTILIKGNRYYSNANIRRALPSLTTNIYLNTHWFEPELDRANANADRQIYPVIGPGLDAGTSELTLKVKDRLPLHGHVEINDLSTPGTPLIRADASVQYNNLWQRNHQAGFDYNFSPQSYKSDNYLPQFYDQPMVASYSGFYRLPLGIGSPLRETYERQPVDFGYNEVTHAFVPLPSTGDPELLIFASRSVSDTPVRYGPLSVIFSNTNDTLNAQSAERDLTYNNDVGARLTVPLRDFAGIHSSLLFGIDYKSYEAPSFSTNLTYFSLYDYDSFGNQTLVTNATIRLPSNGNARLHYLPLSFGWSGAKPDRWGGTTLNFNENIFFSALSSARTDFQTVAGAAAAGGNYTDITAGLTRRQNLYQDWNLQARVNGQWSSAPLIANEEMPLGGTAGVRGYQEGEIYGDEGWRALFDLNAPAIEVGEFPVDDKGGNVPAMLRSSVFTDYGEAWLIDRPASADRAYSEWGAGAALFLTAGEHFYARLTAAWALENTLLTRAGEARVYFNIGWQF